MKHLFLKLQFIIGAFLLINLNVHASDEPITINLDEAGTLSTKIDASEKYKITNLKIVGKLNEDDLEFIREMAGRDGVSETDGKLTNLNLWDARFVWGLGKAFYKVDNGSGKVVKCQFYRNNIVANYAFRDCNSLESIIIPSNTLIMEHGAFMNCRNLITVEFPDGLTSVSDYAFFGCENLISIDLPSSITSIGGSAFSRCHNLTFITIPSGVTKIGDYAFYQCYSLEGSITIPFGVTKIEAATFHGCQSLTNITIPSSVEEIHALAFYDCRSLLSLTIPSSVKYIDSDIMENCNSLKSIYVNWEDPTLITPIYSINKETCTLYVPQGTRDAYLSSRWGDVFDYIVEYDVTGISQVANNAAIEKVFRYSDDGMRMNAPVKGLNIIRYRDGSVRKIFVR